MVEVKFYDTVNDELLKFAVIISQSNGKWVFCKHKERDEYSCAMKSHFRKFGNQMSGSGNHLYNYASLLA